MSLNRIHNGRSQGSRKDEKPPLPYPGNRVQRPATRVLVGALAFFLSLPSLAATVTFGFIDRTGLNAGTYSIYVLGVSTAGGSDGKGLYLDSDGHWKDVSSLPDINTDQSGALPCWELGTDIHSMTLDNTQTGLSGRVYFMVATRIQQKRHGFAVCKPYKTSGFKAFSTSLSSGGVFSFTDDGSGYVAPRPSDVTGGTFPAWVFAEVGGSANAATIDASQVDFISFPLNVLAYPSERQTYAPSYIHGVGNSFDTASSDAGFSSMASVKTSFETYFSIADRYKQLLTTIPGNPRRTTPQYIIQNPGGYLGDHPVASGYCDDPSADSALSFNCDFLHLAEHYLWSTRIATTGEPWTGSVNSGGALGNVEQQTFDGKTVQIAYPGTSHLVNAIEFTGKSTGFVAYVFSPKDIDAMCRLDNNPMPPSDATTLCGTNSSVGFQIYAAAGALGTPPTTQFDNMLRDASTYKLTTSDHNDYQSVAARLGFLISTAFNRGVAGLMECKYNGSVQKIGDCWQDEALWYPTADSVRKTQQQYFNQKDSAQPDLTQNRFSLWLHTARDSNNDYLFAQPVSPQTWTGDANVTFSMGYGFSNDENPTPNPPYTDDTNSPLAGSQTQAQTPSKWDANVPYVDNGHSYIVLGPWESGAPNPSPNAQVQPPPDPPATCASVPVDQLYPYYGSITPPADLVCTSGTSVTDFSAPSETQSNYQWTCNNGHNTASCSSAQIPKDKQWPACAAPQNSSLSQSQPPDATLCSIGTASSYHYRPAAPPTSWTCNSNPLIDGQQSVTKSVNCQAAN